MSNLQVIFTGNSKIGGHGYWKYKFSGKSGKIYKNILHRNESNPANRKIREGLLAVLPGFAI